MKLNKCMLCGYFWQADIDNSGTIDYGEFLAATVHLNKLEREENLVSAFSFFDKDSSGYITIDELQQACKEFGLSELHLDEMIKEIDQDNVSPLCTVISIHFFPLKIKNLGALLGQIIQKHITFVSGVVGASDNM